PLLPEPALGGPAEAGIAREGLVLEGSALEGLTLERLALEGLATLEGLALHASIGRAETHALEPLPIGHVRPGDAGAVPVGGPRRARADLVRLALGRRAGSLGPRPTGGRLGQARAQGAGHGFAGAPETAGAHQRRAGSAGAGAAWGGLAGARAASGRRSART